MKNGQNNNTKYYRKTKLSIFKLIFFVVVLFMIIRIIWGLFAVHPHTEITRYGNLELSEVVTGHIFKNETLIQSPTAGQLQILIPEGTKVKKGAIVASILKDTQTDSAQEKIKKIDQEIAQIEKNLQENNLFDGDIKKIDNKIEEQLDLVSLTAQTGNIENLSQIKDTLNYLINKKKIISNKGGSSESNILTKQKEKDVFTSYINSSKVDIPTSSSGIVSYKIDGYEQIYIPKNLKSFTTKSFEKINVNNNIQVPNKVTAGQAVVKIINNFEWYILCTMKSNKVQPLKENDLIQIEIDKSFVPAKVISINDEQDGNALITLQISTNLEQFYSYRKIDFKIIKANYEGIRLPSKCIINKDGKRGVMIVDRGIIKFKEVDLVGFDDKYVIVEINNKLSSKKGLSLYDEVVINPSIGQENMLIR